MGTIRLNKQTFHSGIEAINGKTTVKAQAYSTIRFDDLVQDIHDHSGVQKPLVRATIEALTHEILDNVANGHRVEIEGLGFFYLKVSAKAQADVRQANASTVRRVQLAFVQDKDIRQELASSTRGVRFELVDEEEDQDTSGSSSSGSGTGSSGTGSSGTGSGDGGEYNENDGID